MNQNRKEQRSHVFMKAELELNGRTVEVNNAEALSRGMLAMIAERDRYDPSALAAYARDAFGVAAFQDRWLNIYRSVKASADVA